MNIRVEDSTTGCSALMSHYYQTCYKDQIRARLKLNRFVIYLDLTYIYILHLKLLNFNTLLKLSLLSQTNRTVLHFGGVVGEHTGYLLIIY